MLLYIERWLKAPVQMADGRLVPRDAGTPQGSVVSPLLSNLFLHYVFNRWMDRTMPEVSFEHYADDIVCHCRTQREAVAVLAKLKVRFAACGLELHLQKTQVVYCKDANRPGSFAVQSFTFLGFGFRPRLAKWPNGKYGVSFLPAASREALKSIGRASREASEGLQRDSPGRCLC